MQPVYQPQEIEEVRSLFRKLDALTTLQARYGLGRTSPA